ncbi:MAG: hypothetical protein ACRD2F_08820, partial [Terriglobales bacterium]
NYSSDIDLMFVYAAPGETGGGTANREFFLSMAQRLTAYVSAPTAEGACYRVDLRLRPGGREGEIALPLERAVAYYQLEAREWERQMLVKARVAAGAGDLGRAFLAAVAPLVYPPPALSGGIAAAVGGARQARARVQAERARRGPSVDVKRDPGGLRDIEFLVQLLQRTHGGAEPWLRVGNTLQALQRLHDKGRLDSGPWQTLASAYTLYRQVEHRLQLRFGEQTHRLPSDAAGLQALARGLERSQAGRRGGGEELADSPAADQAAVAALQCRLESAMAAVAALWRDNGAAAPPGAGGFQLRPPEAAAQAPLAPLAGLSARGRRHWQRLVESAQREAGPRQGLAALAALDAGARERLAAVLEASDYLAEALTLRPAEVALFAESYDWPDERQPSWWPAEAAEAEGGNPAPAPAPLRATPSAPIRTAGAEAMRALRWCYQAATWRQAAAELATPRPVGVALARLSASAEAAIQSALAAAQAESGEPPALGILALGRLGLREFDLFSDADLVFVAAPGDEAGAARLAARVIALLASYTADGTVFPVDARLRPEGREGELAQTPAGLAAYFAARAGAWQAASYLKARAVAGDAALNAAALA